MVARGKKHARSPTRWVTRKQAQKVTVAKKPVRPHLAPRPPRERRHLVQIRIDRTQTRKIMLTSLVLARRTRLPSYTATGWALLMNVCDCGRNEVEEI